MCVLNTVGATLCYLLAGALGRDLLEWLAPARLHSFQAHLARHAEGGLLLELVALRMLPITPHWLVNVASPVVGVPVVTFATAVLVGAGPCAPAMAPRERASPAQRGCAAVAAPPHTHTRSLALPCALPTTGMLPYNFVTVQAGQMLSSLTSVADVLTLGTVAQLAALAVVAAVPAWYVRGARARRGPSGTLPSAVR